MIVFGPVYERILSWMSRHESDKYLYGLSFIESVFFPIPTDVMLAPMCAARPNCAMRLALMTSLFSVAGGVLGYTLGILIFEWIQPWLVTANLWEHYQHAVVLMNEWGLWIILVAAFSPIPYKVFTIGAGVLEQNFALFVFASFVGRSARFFLVAWLLKRWGAAILPKIGSRIETIGWVTIIILLAVMVVYYLQGT